MATPSGPLNIAIGGGQAGAGKTALAVNLGVAMVQAGRRVVLVDADPVAPSVAAYLGVERIRGGFAAYTSGATNAVRELLSPTPIAGLTLIAGEPRSASSAPLTAEQRVRLVAGLQWLDADAVLVDIGGGPVAGFVDFFQLADLRLLVVTPELAALQSSYAFLKGALFRALRDVALEMGEEAIFSAALRATGAGKLRQVVASAYEQKPELAGELARCAETYSPLVVANRVANKEQADALFAFSRMIADFLSVRAPVACSVPESSAMRDSSTRGRPLMWASHASDAAGAIRTFVEKVLGLDVDALRNRRHASVLATAPERRSTEIGVPPAPPRSSASVGGQSAPERGSMVTPAEHPLMSAELVDEPTTGSRRSSSGFSAQLPSNPASAVRRQASVAPVRRSASPGAFASGDPVAGAAGVALPGPLDAYQRRHARFGVKWPVRIRLGEFDVDGVVIDVSGSGASITGDRLPFGEGETITLVFTGLAEIGEVSATVRSSSGGRAGVEFVDAAGSGVKLLAAAIEAGAEVVAPAEAPVTAVSLAPAVPSTPMVSPIPLRQSQPYGPQVGAGVPQAPPVIAAVEPAPEPRPGWRVRLEIEGFQIEARLTALDSNSATLEGTRLPFAEGEVVRIVFIEHGPGSALDSMARSVERSRMEVDFSGARSSWFDDLVAKARTELGKS